MTGTDPSSHTDLESTVLPSLLRYGLDAWDTLGHGRSNGDQKLKPYGPEEHIVAEFAQIRTERIGYAGSIGVPPEIRNPVRSPPQILKAVSCHAMLISTSVLYLKRNPD
jgi:hypothetical protein